MATKSPTFLDKLKPHPKKIFLIDGLGALVSAFFLGVILVQFEAYFGMPQKVLFTLAALASVYAMYSLACAYLVPHPWPPFLLAIAIANFLHCCLTIGLAYYFYEQLTVLGFLYFFLELAIVLTLVVVEIKIARLPVKSKAGVQ